MINWQFIYDGRVPSNQNMNIDRECFQSVSSGDVPGLLRLYNWSEPALTLGYNQKDYLCHDPELRIGKFSRPTGGGTVLHADDLTYCVAAPLDGCLGHDIVSSYAAIAELFAEALRLSGIPVCLADKKASFSPVCFDRSAEKELVVDGLKVMGAAQMRSRGYFLQQGVIPLTVNYEMVERVFGVKACSKYRGLLEINPEFDLGWFVDRLRAVFEDRLGFAFADREHQQGCGHHAEAAEVDLG